MCATKRAMLTLTVKPGSSSNLNLLVEVTRSVFAIAFTHLFALVQA